MNFENLKIRGSRENLVDTKSGEFNASSKNELKKSILAALGKPVAADKEAETAVREEVKAAFNDRTTNKFATIGAAIAGELYNINTFNQPGVEQAKNYTYALMGRSGYEDSAAQIQNKMATV